MSWGAIAAGGLNTLGTYMTNKANKEINKANLEWAKYKTMNEWKRQDTAYQRMAADMENAGINKRYLSGS